MPNILAIDTASEACSVALIQDDHLWEKTIVQPKGHTQLILSMLDGLLAEAKTTLQDLDAIAFGQGPGSFTGVRIAAAVTQGLAFGLNKLTLGISNLQALALQAFDECTEQRVLCVTDARMHEVYWAIYERGENNQVIEISPEALSKPDEIVLPDTATDCLLHGNGCSHYGEALLKRYPHLNMHDLLNTSGLAPQIASIAHTAFLQDKAGEAQTALPVYLRAAVQ